MYYKRQHRMGDIDLLRSMGIILMIMGHVYFGEFFDKFIHAFHMPLWFIISGYFCKTDMKVSNFILKKFKALMIPYFVFGVGYECIWTLLGHNQWMGILFPNSIEVPLNGALWFLPAMFLADVIGYFIIKKIQGYSMIFIFTVIGLIGSYTHFTLPFSLNSAFVGVGFYGIGYLIGKYPLIIFKEHNVLYDIISFILISCSIFMNGYVNVRTNEYAIVPLFWTNAIMSVIIFWNICKWVEDKKDFCFLKEMGSDSMIYVCMNQFLLFILKRVGNIINAPYCIWKIVEVLLILSICFWLNRAYKNIRLIFGGRS